MKDKNKVAVVMLTALIVIMLVLLGVVIYWRARVLQQTNQDTQEDTQYIYHYVLISDKGNSTFWDHVYEGACAYGEENDAYIERMGDELAVNYSKEELMEIAIYAGVDGILLEGDESSVQKEMIDKAVEAGIPVVTMLNDNYGSLRQTFVGVGNYNLGREYAREVIRIATPDTKRVLILGDKIYEGQAQTLIMNGFSDTIYNEGNHLELAIEMMTVNSEDSFAVQETIREIVLEESVLPDIIICLNEINTMNAYQVIVDYNMVGQVKIIGYYSSDTILSAIDKEVITSTSVFDAEEMGWTAAQALNEYRETGYVNDYITLEAEVVSKNNIREYLEDEEKAE